MDQNDQAFELLIAIQTSDIDELGHVNNVSYLRWVQDAAVAHWKAQSSATDQAAVQWVVLRHEIEYRHAAFLQDGIIAKTWVGTASRLRFERHTELLRAADRRLLAKARTIYCPINARTGRPTAVSEEVRRRFSRE